MTTADVVKLWPKAEEFGFPNEEAAFALQYGHGVGLAIWEKPVFSRLVSFDSPEMIEEGMVFALETFWPASDGWSAARIEEQLVVTKDGCEVITRFPAEELLVAGGGHPTVGGPLPGVRETQSNLNNPSTTDAVVRVGPAGGSGEGVVATEVIMPALGLAQETGKVLRWLKAEGESVAKGEPLLEVETDKVTVEVEAPAEGILGGLRAGEGDDVPSRPGRGVRPGAGRVGAGAGCGHRGATRATEAEPAEASAEPKPGPKARRRLASPKARRLAHEHGIELDSVTGSGPHGSVLAADLEGANGDGAATLEAGPVWQRMAERVARSWQTVPHFFLLREVDAGGLQAWRETARRRPGCEALTHSDLLIRICAAALREHPRVNATWRDGSVIAQDEINVGLAVATDDALVVPVIHGADTLDLPALAARRAQLVEAARAGRLVPADVQGGTFTVSNLGMYGVDAFLAVVNAPQAAILAVGRIADRVVAADGAPAVRPVMTLSLSFDHRVVDGARGALFVDTLAALVEEPAGLVA